MKNNNNNGNGQKEKNQNNMVTYKGCMTIIRVVVMLFPKMHPSRQPVSRLSQPASHPAIPIQSGIIRGIIHFSSIFIVRILQRNGKRKEISIPFMDEILTINRFSYFVRETKRFLIHFDETVFFMRYIVCDDQLISFRMPCRCSCLMMIIQLETAYDNRPS